MSSHSITEDGDAETQVSLCWIGVGANAANLRDFMADLEVEERTRAARFHREDDRHRFVLGRALTRRVCAHRLGIPCDSVPLVYSDSGKPALDPACGLDLPFNVSHAGHWVLAAWCERGLVGVDVESLAHRLSSPPLDIAARVFSEGEMAALRTVAAESVLPTFFRVWSRKEALLKAEGWGLGGPLQSFDVARVDDSAVIWPDRVESPASGRVWQMTDLVGPEGYAAALASPPGSTIQRCEPSAWGFQ